MAETNPVTNLPQNKPDPSTSTTAPTDYTSGVYAPQTGNAASTVAPIKTAPTVTAPTYQAAQGTTSNAATTNAATAATTAQNGTSTDWNVNKDQTVAGQVQGIIADNSPLMQQAVAQANAAANGKGLLNSSMAVTAGQSALYSAATPIAQADAATNAEAAKTNAAATNTQSLTNQQAQNQATAATAAAQNTANLSNANAANSTSQFNASQQNAMTAQNVNAQNDASKSNQAATLQASLANQSAAVSQASDVYDNSVKSAMQTADANTQIQLAAIDTQNKTTLMNLQAKYNVQMQTSQSMATTYSQLITQMTAVMSDKDMDATSKQVAINSLTTLYDNAMQMQSSLSGLNLGQLLDPTALNQPLVVSGGSSTPGTGTGSTGSTGGTGTATGGASMSAPGSNGLYYDPKTGSYTSHTPVPNHG